MTTDELEIWKALNECECVKRVFGAWLMGDSFIVLGENKLRIVIKEFAGNLLTIWIPSLYDPVRPERSLWGIACKSIPYNIRKTAFENCMVTDRPDLALAKAILEQEEKE